MENSPAYADVLAGVIFGLTDLAGRGTVPSERPALGVLTAGAGNEWSCRLDWRPIKAVHSRSDRHVAQDPDADGREQERPRPHGVSPTWRTCRCWPIPTRGTAVTAALLRPAAQLPRDIFLPLVDRADRLAADRHHPSPTPTGTFAQVIVGWSENDPPLPTVPSCAGQPAGLEDVEPVEPKPRIPHPQMRVVSPMATPARPNVPGVRRSISARRGRMSTRTL